MSTILFLEIDDDFRSLAAELLRANELEVIEVDTTVTAHSVLASTAVDLVVVSDFLPDGHGTSFIAKLRASNSTVRIVFVSALWRDLQTYERLDTYERLTADFSVSSVIYRPVAADDFVIDVLRILDDPGIRAGTARYPSVVAEFDLLQKQFTARLPQKLREIEAAVARARADHSCIREARALTHRLRGSASCYGYPELSEVIGRAEDLLAQVQAHPSFAGNYLWDEINKTLRDPHLHDDPEGGLSTLAAVARSRRTLLVVDEDPDFLQLVARVGGRLVLNVITAETAPEALQLARTTPLMGVVIDIKLRDQRAFSLARAIRATDTNSDVPIVFASADQSISTRFAVIEAGGTHFLEKPTSEENINALAQHLATQSDTAPARVLIVDDDPEIAAYFAVHLRDAGMSVDLLTSSDGITSSLDEMRAEVLLLAGKLPGISGFDVCRALRMSARFELLPILVVSAETDDRTSVLASHAGVSDVIARHASPEELVARVRVQLEHARLQRERADTDALSGLLSRRAFIEAFQRALAVAMSSVKPVAMALIDLDLFKGINDTYGHLVGDRVIAGFGELLRDNFQQGDIRGRWGGEEFMLVFPGQDVEFAERATKRLLSEFSALRFSAPDGGSFGATFTAGVASYPRDGASFSALVHCADKRLYMGKQGGRNRIVAFGAAESSPRDAITAKERNMKVLLIDDEEDIRKVGRLSLEAVGRFETSVAASGREGIDLAREIRPDFILMDMMMPGMDGLAALAELKSTPDLKDIPVIFLTAKVQRSEMAFYVKKGAIAVIQKPFDPMMLPTEINQILRTHGVLVDG